MGNAAATLAEPDRERYESALAGHELNADPARAFALDEAALCQPSGAAALHGEGSAAGERPGAPGNAAACEELLVDMWRRRNAVEHALRVANDLYAEAEAAAMAAYTRAKGGGVPHSWWKEQGSAQRPALTPAQREEAIARLLSERAALAEADLLVYATHSAAWAEFMALNPLFAIAAAQQAAAAPERPLSRSPSTLLRGTPSPPGVAPPAAAEDAAGQAIRDGRRYLYSAPLRPGAGRPPLSGPGLGDAAGAQHSAAADAAALQELAATREELGRARRRLVELARAEREARDEARAIAASSSSLQTEVEQLRATLRATEAGLDDAMTLVQSIAAQAAGERSALQGRGAALRNQLAASRDATEQVRWDASASLEAIACEKARFEQRAAALEGAADALVQNARREEVAERAAPADADDALALRVALSDAEARCASLAGQRDAALARAVAAQQALTARAADVASARERVQAAEKAVADALAAQRELQSSASHAAEAARASAAERAALASANVALQAQLDEVKRSLQQLPAVPPPGSAPRAPSYAASVAQQSELDWMSDVAASEGGSVLGDGADVASLRAVRGDRAREEARARAAANRAKFEAMKAERNALKVEARRSASELNALRAEAARVEELQTQLRSIQTSLFL